MLKYSDIPTTAALLDLIPLTAVAVTVATTGIMKIRQGESHAKKGEPEEKLKDRMIDDGR